MLVFAAPGWFIPLVHGDGEHDRQVKAEGRKAQVLDVFVVEVREGHGAGRGGVGEGVAAIGAAADQHIVAGAARVVPQNPGSGVLQIPVAQAGDLHAEAIDAPADVADAGAEDAPEEHPVMEKLPDLRLGHRLGEVTGGVIDRHEAAAHLGHRAAAVGDVGHEVLADQVALFVAAAFGNIHLRPPFPFPL